MLDRVIVPEQGLRWHSLGSHHIFSHPDIEEVLNLQPRGSLAKPYQVKQVRKVIIRYKLVPESE
jgi:hypothetical protein